MGLLLRSLPYAHVVLIRIDSMRFRLLSCVSCVTFLAFFETRLKVTHPFVYALSVAIMSLFGAFSR